MAPIRSFGRESMKDRARSENLKPEPLEVIDLAGRTSRHFSIRNACDFKTAVGRDSNDSKGKGGISTLPLNYRQLALRGHSRMQASDWLLRRIHFAGLKSICSSVTIPSRSSPPASTRPERIGRPSRSVATQNPRHSKYHEIPSSGVLWPAVRPT